MCHKTENNRFAELPTSGRIWAVPAIHGHLDPLFKIHDHIYEFFQPGDQLLYMGNYTGYGPNNVEVIDELLTFRRLIMALPAVTADDIIYLRGQQEEMISRLLQLQFAPKARPVLEWMLENGLEATMKSYGIDISRGLRASLECVTGLGYWTKQVKSKIHAHIGHDLFMTTLRRAAYTPMSSPRPILFVHAGLQPQKALSIQGDNFWWSSQDFTAMSTPYRPFERVIRGYDPEHKGLYINGVTATIDSGCGFGGDLVYACIDSKSGELDILTA